MYALLVPLLDPVLSAITMLHIFRARDFSLGSSRVERNCLLALRNRPRGTQLDKSSPLDKTRTGHLVRQSKHLPGVRGTEENINVCPARQLCKLLSIVKQYLLYISLRRLLRKYPIVGINNK